MVKSIASNYTYGKNGKRIEDKKVEDIAKKYHYQYYDIGTEITIGTEKFNVIKDEGDSVTLMAQYNLGTDYRQSTTNNYVTFADTKTWERYETIDLQTMTTNPKNYVNNYVSYLRTITNDNTITGSLATQDRYLTLWCDLQGNYEEKRCESSPYKSWVINGQETWTLINYESIKYVDSEGLFIESTSITTDAKGIRPIITISKDTLAGL